jgi:predicted PurR-regulated permease PerM
VLTAIAQGTLTGIGMAICGIPGAVFWGAVAAVFALLPLVGAAIVWVPAAIYLFLDAAYHSTGMGWGIFMVVWGVGAVSLIDNVIRPWAMKGGADMPAVLLLFSVLGGVRAFGFMGILLGPLIFALLVSVIDIYKEFFRTTLEKQDAAPG